MRFKYKILSYLSAFTLLFGDMAYADTQASKRSIISLSPHTTEIIYELGLEKQLLAIDDYSNYPVSDKTRIGSGYQPNLEKISLLAADIILAFTPTRELERMQALNPTSLVYYSNPKTIDALLQDIRWIAEQLGQAQASQALISQWQTIQKQLQTSYQGKTQLTVYFFLDQSRLYTLGGNSFLSQAIQQCHAVNQFQAIKQAAFITSKEAISLTPPDIVLMGIDSKQDIASVRKKAFDFFNSLGIQLSEKQLITMNADVLYRPTPRFLSALPTLCQAIDANRPLNATAKHQ